MHSSPSGKEGLLFHFCAIMSAPLSNKDLALLLSFHDASSNSVLLNDARAAHAWSLMLCAALKTTVGSELPSYVVSVTLNKYFMVRKSYG